jgi:hypothetical protein
LAFDSLDRALRSGRINYQQGDHACAFYASPHEQFSAAIEFFHGGLSRGERCLYICCEPVDAIRAALARALVDVDAEERRGALVLSTKHDFYLKDGTFDPDKVFSSIYDIVEEALNAGFSGVCGAGDMSWLLESFPGSDRILEYEARLTQFCQSNPLVALCQYDRLTLPFEVLDHSLVTHPHVRREGPIVVENPFFESPELALHRTPRPELVSARIRQLMS